MKLIPLTQNQVAIVDDRDAHLAEWKWCATNNFYAVRQCRRDENRQQTVRLHHAVIGQPINRRLDVDHINGNPLDNRRINLRIVTRRTNASNSIRKRSGRTTSKFSGVTWNKKIKKWRSYIKISGKQRHLGLFISEIDAANAYQSALSGIETEFNSMAFLRRGK